MRRARRSIILPPLNVFLRIVFAVTHKINVTHVCTCIILKGYCPIDQCLPLMKEGVLTSSVCRFPFPNIDHVYSQGNYTLISLHLNDVPQRKLQRNSWHGLSCENKMHKFSKWFIHNLIHIECQKDLTNKTGLDCRIPVHLLAYE